MDPAAVILLNLRVCKPLARAKKEAMTNGTEKDKIFSFNTYQTYWKHTKYFLRYVRENYPDCSTLKSAKKYVNEWLQTRVDQELSAWTVQTEAKALGKLYGIQPEDKDYFTPPKRNQEDIKRSRGDKVRDRHFSVANNFELIAFCQGTGLRRSELIALKGKDLIARSQLEAEVAQLEKTAREGKRLAMLKDAFAAVGFAVQLSGQCQRSAMLAGHRVGVGNPGGGDVSKGGLIPLQHRRIQNRLGDAGAVISLMTLPVVDLHPYLVENSLGGDNVSVGGATGST